MIIMIKILKQQSIIEYNKQESNKQVNNKEQGQQKQMCIVKEKIKSSLSIITYCLKQIPQDKQPLITNRINKVLQKHLIQQNQSQLQAFSKQLQFNLNFIKLSYPNINFKFEEIKSQKNQTNDTKPNDQIKEEFSFIDGGMLIQNSEGLRKQMVDINNIREEVQFMNWSEGNVDPDNLKRHKQLLTRQHFGGEFWEGKEIPKMQSAQIVANMIQDPNVEKPQITQKDFEKKPIQFKSDPSTRFQKVKR